jgi:hypothetical protein
LIKDYKHDSNNNNISYIPKKFLVTTVQRQAITCSIDTFEWITDNTVVVFKKFLELQRLKLDHEDTGNCPQESHIVFLGVPYHIYGPCLSL